MIHKKLLRGDGEVLWKKEEEPLVQQEREEAPNRSGR